MDVQTRRHSSKTQRDKRPSAATDGKNSAQIASMDRKYNQLFQDLRQEKADTTGQSSGIRHEPERGGGIQTHAIRLEFPHFEGIDPTRWVYRAEQFLLPPNPSQSEGKYRFLQS